MTYYAINLKAQARRRDTEGRLVVHEDAGTIGDLINTCLTYTEEHLGVRNPLWDAVEVLRKMIPLRTNNVSALHIGDLLMRALSDVVTFAWELMKSDRYEWPRGVDPEAFSGELEAFVPDVILFLNNPGTALDFRTPTCPITIIG